MRLVRNDFPTQSVDLRERHFYFTLLRPDVTAWIERGTTKYYSTTKLVEELLEMLLQQLLSEK